MGKYDDLLVVDQPPASKGKYADLLSVGDQPSPGKYDDLVALQQETPVTPKPEPERKAPGFLEHMARTGPGINSMSGLQMPKEAAKDVLIDTPKEVPKGVARGLQQFGSAVGSAIEAGGDYIDTQQRQFKRLFYESPIGQRVLEKRQQKYLAEHGGKLPPAGIDAAPETAGGKVSGLGEDVHDFWQEAASTGWEARDPEIYSGTFKENPSLARVVGGASESAPTMIAALALSAGGLPNAGAILLAGSEALPIYTEAKRLGVSEKDAFSYALISGIGTAALERVGLDALTGKIPMVDALIEKMGANWAAGAMVNFAAEGTQEALQEIYQNAVAMGYDGDRKLLEGALEAGLVGGFMGSGAGASRQIVSDYMQKQSERTESYKGLNAQQIDQVVRDAQKPITTPEGAPVTVETEQAQTDAPIDKNKPIATADVSEQGEMDVELTEKVIEQADKEQPISTEQPTPKQKETAVSSPPADIDKAGEAVQSSTYVRDDGKVLKGEVTSESDTHVDVRTEDGVNHHLPKKFWNEQDGEATESVEALEDRAEPQPEEAGSTPAPAVKEAAPTREGDVGKESWEITREEFAGPESAASEMEFMELNKFRYKQRDHKIAVEKALAEGKPVPPEVLKDYPELSDKQTQPATTDESAPNAADNPPNTANKPAIYRTIAELRKAEGNVPRNRIEGERGKWVVKGEVSDGKKPSQKRLYDALVESGAAREQDRGKQQFAYSIRKNFPNGQWLSINDLIARMRKAGRSGGEAENAIIRKVGDFVKAGVVERMWTQDGLPVYAWKGTAPTGSIMTEEQVNERLAREGQALDKPTEKEHKEARDEGRTQRTDGRPAVPDGEERSSDGGKPTPKKKRPATEAQKRQRAEFTRKAQPVDQGLANFRRNNPLIRTPSKDNPLYEELYGKSAKEPGIIPRSRFRNNPNLREWDQIVHDAQVDIPHIVGKDDTGPEALAKIYNGKIQTIGQMEAENDAALDNEMAEHIHRDMLEDIQSGLLPPYEFQERYPDIFQNALEAAGADAATLRTVDYPDAYMEEYAGWVEAYEADLAAQESGKPAESMEEWQKRMGIEPEPEQTEMFGKGAVGDVFELRPQTIKGKESFGEKQEREAKQEEAEKAQTDIFEPTPQSLEDQAKDKKQGGKPVDKMTKAELHDRAKELGVPFEQTILMADLRKKVKQAEKGGFVDVANATRDPSKKEHPFIKQQRDNDMRVHAWKKKQTRSWLSNLAAKSVDRQSDIKKALKDADGDEAVMRLVLRQGASAESSRQFKAAEKKINDVMPRKYRTTLKDYIAAMRVVEATKVQADRDIELKSPVEAEDAKNWLADEFQSLPAEQRDAVMEAAQVYWNTMREQLDSLHNEGLIGDEAHQSISDNHKFYSPRRFVEFIDPVTLSPKGERTHDSGVKNLGEGSETALAQDPSYLLAHVIARTQSRIFQNKANKALHDLAQTDGGKSMVRMLRRFEKTDKETEKVTYQFEPTKRNEGLVKVFIDGVEVRMAMDAKLAEEWNGLTPAMSQDMAQFIQWATGTKVLKALATGANPEFAISNLPRDAMYAWFVSGQYSTFLPKALMQIGVDYAQSAKDAVRKTGAYNDYIAEGGGMDFLTTQGMTHKPNIEGGNRVARKIGDILSWAGETSEIATRLAVVNRGLKNGLSMEEAVYVARNMLDFSQGGTYAKAADNAIPYLNAAIQGTRGGFRAFKTDPAGTTFKAAQLASIGYGMAWAIAHFFPDLWDSIDDREKATKWIIPLGYKTTDKNGNTRHAYIAIPKDQFQQFFAAVGQSMADGQSGRPWSGQILSSIQAISPVDATTLPPVVAATTAYFGNYDTWTRDHVWKGYEDISPHNEFTYRTPEVAKDVADVASRVGVEISPDRLATATSKIIPRSNPLGGMFASMYGVMQNDDSNVIGETTVERVKATPFLRRLLRFSRSANVQPYTQGEADRLEVDTDGMTDREARQKVKEAATERADMRQPMNVSLDKWMADTDDLSGGKVRVWLRDNIDDHVERQRLWTRAKTKYPDDITGSYRTKAQRPSKLERPSKKSRR